MFRFSFCKKKKKIKHDSPESQETADSGLYVCKLFRGEMKTDGHTTCQTDKRIGQTVTQQLTFFNPLFIYSLAVSLSLFLSFCLLLSLSLSLYLYLSLSICISLSFSLSICISLSLSHSPSQSVSLSLSLYLSLSLSHSPSDL